MSEETFEGSSVKDYQFSYRLDVYNLTTITSHKFLSICYIDQIEYCT